MSNMMALPDYQLTELIYEGNANLVWRGIRKKDNVPIIVKFLKNTYPTNEQIARFKYEFNLIQTLGKEVTVEAYDLLPYQNSFVMVLEEFGTETLKELLAKRTLSLTDGLSLAIKMVEALTQIQLKNVIHKDLNPANILIDEVTGKVKIIDFGLATTLSRENPEVRTPNVLEGALAYISPEQTGRMNRGIDYRSDYYSLGVIFYEMFTGQLPFQSNDALELVHSHIAKPPSPLFEVNENVPPILSDLVLKLLAKSPEERYQSTAGIKSDLETCLEQLKEYGVIEPFPLGTKDFTYHFQIPEKLYGREFEIQTILESFDKISKGSAELILVTGYSGIGKTRLVQEIYKPILEKKGWVISGKFDKIRKNTPYFAILQAFYGLIQQILLEPQKQLNLWKEQLLSALGPNGQVMIEVLPILEELIGSQPSVLALNPKESQNRFHLIFLNFIRAFTLAETPLVIFLDDMQWADPPSLKLLELLMIEQEIRYLLVIGSYRDNEVDAAHPLMITLDNLKKSEVPYQTLLLRPLSLLDIQQLLADTLHYEKRDVLELATLCLEKTQGNPFFLNQFLQTLYDSNLIEFNQTIGKWVFDINAIRNQGITENVVELMIGKFKHLSSQAQETLRYASCIGNQFDLKTLALVLEKTTKNVSEELWESLREGFIIPLNENYKFTSEKEMEDALYKFLHDGVREAAYSTIKSSGKKRIHLKIGRLILKNSTQQQQEERIFDIVQHLNIGAELVTEEIERALLIRLNLLSGEKAFISAAYDSAYTYFHFGLNLLSKNCWEENYEIALALYIKSAETSYLLGQYDEMETLSNLILKNAKILIDKVKVYEIKIMSYIIRNELLKAISESIAILKQLGINLPKNPNNLHIIIKLIKLKWLLFGKKIENMVQLPPMTDPYKLAAQRLMASAATAGYFAMPLLYACCICEDLGMCIKSNNTPRYPSSSYMAYGAVCCGILDEINQGYAFGKAALKLVEQYGRKDDEARSLLVFYGCIDHWKNPLSSSLPGLQNAYLRGLEVGAFEDSAYTVIIYVLTSFFAGIELDTTKKYMEKFHLFFEHHEHKTAFSVFIIFRQLIQNMTKPRPDPWNFTGDFYDEEKYPSLHRKEQVNIALYTLYSSKGIISYLFYNESLAMSNFELAEPYKNSAMGTFALSAGIFFKTLTMLALYPKEEPSKKRKLLNSIKKNLQLFKKWASYSPNNYLQKYYLIEAEFSRISGTFGIASNFYEKAISFSKKNGFLNDEALSYELTGKFYLAQDKITIATLYLTKAYHSYLSWGAITKVGHLEQQYPFLITKEIGMSDSISSGLTLSSTLTFRGTSTTRRSEMLDLSTAMKASQAIASEVDLEDLLKKLMSIVLENSGAENGYLILEENGQWVIDAEEKSNPKQITILQSLSIEKLPYAIINQVIRKKQTIILDNASQNGEYVHDPHIISGKQKSILCMPLISQNTLKGVLYLENNLLAGVFTRDRLYLLETLSSQIVISIENAKLYSRLKLLNKAYERFVPYQFLKFLGKKEITDVKLGDHIEKEMTVLFCDIRNFTTISEKLTPLENFAFINDFFKRAEPIISKNHGFIDKYIGDAIMALYPTSVEDAIKSAIALLNNLKELNLGRDHKEAVKIGIGLNTGLLMLGTVGDEHRMEGTVISDAVNIAARIEDLTKNFETSLLISEDSYRRIQNPKLFAIRSIGDLNLKGKTKPVRIYEVFSADQDSTLKLKQQTQIEFEQAVQLYQQKKFNEALIIFQKIIDLNPEDAPARYYKSLCSSGIKVDF